MHFAQDRVSGLGEAGVIALMVRDRNRKASSITAGKGERMPKVGLNHWELLKEKGFTALCVDWNADGSEMVCEIMIDPGFGAPECISCRQAYRKDEDGNLEYFR
jgi:hypothetical protein